VELIDVLKDKTASEIASLMKLSDSLATLNADRYAAWEPSFTPEHARQAVLAFNGDVYEGLDAPNLKPADLKWMQAHLLILSGLYGALRPLDMMRPYRLEMGTRLTVGDARNLYQFWGDRIAEYIS